jgi:hypothetical protein
MSEARPSGEIALFQSEDDHTKIQVRMDGLTVWLPQRSIAELYQVSVKTANEHLVSIYDERHQLMSMADWTRKLDDFLKFNEHNVLTHSGKISQSLAQEHAERGGDAAGADPGFVFADPFSFPILLTSSPTFIAFTDRLPKFAVDNHGVRVRRYSREQGFMIKANAL